MSKQADKKRGKKALLGIAASIVTILVVLTTYREIVQAKLRSRTQYKNDGIAIDEKKYVDINGIRQFMYIRGSNVDNPILLWLDGGPGEPLSAYCREIAEKTGIEKDFTVVYWDQRGSGKSASTSLKEKDFTFEQYLSDVEQVTAYIKETFGREKIYVLGRSWGSRIGLMSVVSHPEDYYAYIGIGQTINRSKELQSTIEFCLACAKENGDQQKVEQYQKVLNRINQGELIRTSEVHYGSYVYQNGGFSHQGRESLVKQIIRCLLTSPDYSLAEAITALRTVSFPPKAMEDEIASCNLLEYINQHSGSLQLPAYFLEGRYDYQVSSKAATKEIEKIPSTTTKEIIWFEESGHPVNDDEAEKFYDVMVNTILKQTYH